MFTLFQISKLKVAEGLLGTVKREKTEFTKKKRGFRGAMIDWNRATTLSSK